MKKSTAKILIASAVAAATVAVVAGVIYELKVIKRLTTDIDELSEDEILPEELEAAAEETADEAEASV